MIWEIKVRSLFHSLGLAAEKSVTNVFRDVLGMLKSLYEAERT